MPCTACWQTVLIRVFQEQAFTAILWNFHPKSRKTGEWRKSSWTKLRFIMEPAKKVTRFVEAHAISYRTLLDEDGRVANSYNVVGVPMIILVDKNGYIVKVGHSSSEMPLDKVLQAK